MLKMLNKNDENIVCTPKTIIVDPKILGLKLCSGPKPVLIHLIKINKLIRNPIPKISNPIADAFSIVNDLEIKSTNQSDCFKCIEAYVLANTPRNKI